MWPFDSKPVSSSRGIPTQKVMSMSSQGIPQIEIIRALKNEGFTPSEVDTAMKSALRTSVAGRGGAPNYNNTPPGIGQPPESVQGQDLTPQGPGALNQPGAETAPANAGELGMPPLPGEAGFQDMANPPGSQYPPGEMPPDQPYPQQGQPYPQQGQPYPQQGQPYPQQGQDYPQQGQDYPQQGDDLQPPQQPMEPYPTAQPGQPYPQQGQQGQPGPEGVPEPQEPIPKLREASTRREASDDRRRAIEEMIEGIIEEKWSQFASETDDIKNQFENITARLSALEDTLTKVDDDKKDQFVEIEDKIDTYKQAMGEISSKVGAVESAMKNTMTPMMQTMRSLTHAVKELRSTDTGDDGQGIDDIDIPELDTEPEPTPKKRPEPKKPLKKKPAPKKKPEQESEPEDFAPFDEGPEDDLEKKP